VAGFDIETHTTVKQFIDDPRPAATAGTATVVVVVAAAGRE
jgi:hypothetical protein